MRCGPYTKQDILTYDEQLSVYFKRQVTTTYHTECDRDRDDASVVHSLYQSKLQQQVVCNRRRPAYTHSSEHDDGRKQGR